MLIKRWLPALSVATALSVTVTAFAGIRAEEGRDDDKDASAKPATGQFEKPVRLTCKGKMIKIEQPGYASPCFADIDGDGKSELLVGQYSGGKIGVFKGLDGTDFASREWLRAEGTVAEVPGVW